MIYHILSVTWPQPSRLAPSAWHHAEGMTEVLVRWKKQFVHGPCHGHTLWLFKYSYGKWPIDYV